MKKVWMISLQFVFIHLFLLCGYGIKQIIALPLPAPMIGLVLLFICLLIGIVKLEWVENVGNWLLAELLLFFIPSAVGIINYQDIFSLMGLESIFLIGLSTFIVIATTALTAEFIDKKKGSV
ncbi:CidA/LrgA family protein [Metabacillus malikii]|uniref:Holin-like protein n=1 Tax=Metabacillus malikii TaxID=1504265 RepID=A0ABT9ZCJ2_9BACI|nr:CidA/LrgA family protein [Metabacillus malikii]MDQ0229979.1 holin-like protein [Metabacillus malikii]